MTARRTVLAVGLLAVAAAPVLAAQRPARPIPGALHLPIEPYADSWRGWPVAPLDRQHPIRGSFLDPRPDGFHIGVDVTVPDDQPEPGAPPQRTHRVFALEGGVVQVPTDVARVGCVNGRVDAGHFSYLHLDPTGVVVPGQHVQAGQHIGWTCRTMWHIHVSEWSKTATGRVWVNPLRSGGKIAPYADTASPRIGQIRFFGPARTSWRWDRTNAVTVPAAGAPLPTQRLRGSVDARVVVSDPQSFSGWLATDHPELIADHHPQRVRVELTRLADGRRVLARDLFRAEALSENGRVLPPLTWPTTFTTHYAPGTMQNLGAEPCVAGLQPRTCRGTYWLRLFAAGARTAWDTQRARDGRYRLVVRAWDSAGNASSRSAVIAVRNR
jgi:hypothetical protein